MAVARVKQEGANVLLEMTNGTMPASAARELGRALLSAAMAADEYAHANQVILDSAILLRAGFPMGFSSHPKILAEARKEAQSNRDLRRYMPGGIKSKEQIGRPCVSNVPGTSPAERAAAAKKEKIT